MPKAQNSTAADGNLLEVLNMALNGNSWEYGNLILYNWLNLIIYEVNSQDFTWRIQYQIIINTFLGFIK